MKQFSRICAATAFAAVCCTTACADELADALRQPMLPSGQNTAYTTIFNELEELDSQADDAWRQLTSLAAFRARQAHLRERMTAAIGGFPERTPLNPKIVATVPRDGYRIEKILMESQPGHYLTGLLYLPDEAKFKPPYPAVIVTCGHSDNGKGSGTYQRICVQAAQRGLATFIYDPVEQGERMQPPAYANCKGHNAIGVLSSLLGWSMARFRIWDGMRCLDYLASRPDIRSGKLGVMGNSGGGTMTSLIMAMDDRVQAAAPSCYLTSLREVCRWMGPQDAEQNIFGQLAFGLNHAGYILLRAPSPVSVTCTYNDMFPNYGTRETYRIVRCLADRFGWSERFMLADVPGPHGWRESTRAASVQWMAHWLGDSKDGFPLDMAANRRLDLGFSEKTVDCGLPKPDYNVTPNGKVSELPGFRSCYDLLADELDRVEKARNGKTLNAAGLAAAARRLAGIRPLSECGAVTVEIASSETNGVRVMRFAFAYPSGLAIPAVLCEPAQVTQSPVLIVNDTVRTDAQKRMRELLGKGHPVMVADIHGVGENTGFRHAFYGAPNKDEGIAAMLYLMGKSLVGVKAEDIVVCADALQKRYEKPVSLEVSGNSVVPGAHAYAVERGLFAGIQTENAPLGWAAAIRGRAIYRYANAVNGALREYDWPELLK